MSLALRRAADPPSPPSWGPQRQDGVCRPGRGWRRSCPQPHLPAPAQWGCDEQAGCDWLLGGGEPAGQQMGRWGIQRGMVLCRKDRLRLAFWEGSARQSSQREGGGKPARRGSAPERQAVTGRLAGDKKPKRPIRR